MKYNTSIKTEKKECMAYFMKLINKKQIIEVKKVSPNRTLNQNSYLHLILSAFGMHFGYTLEESKQIYKEVNKQIYKYSKENRGKTMTFYRSSADLSKEEMAKTIDEFMKISAEAGYALPPADDPEWIRWVSNEVEKEEFKSH